MTAKPPLAVAFLWHMHQPYYRDLVTGENILPWVRLHAIKDYYDMVARLDDFPKIKQTFNLVPSLLKQLEDYVNLNATDKYWDHSVKPAGELDHEERFFILQNFFTANWETMIKPYPRYYELLLKRGRFVSPDELRGVAKRLMVQDFLDLQVWHNLSWVGEIYKEKDPLIKELLSKEKNYTEEDKRLLLEKQREIMGKVIDKYREAAARGQVELTVTPFYHPILPLLCDTTVAKIASPDISLPRNHFAYPEDARWQIEQAVAFHTSRFGIPPAGMWPSEGSVSEEIVPLIAGAGIRYIATDSEILAQSIARMESRPRTLSAAELFRPYLFEKEGNPLAIFFRDHTLSDLIGFVYYRWKGEDAAEDLLSKLRHIWESLPADGRQYVVSLILDGENAWEYYPQNGRHFFTTLFERLGNDPYLRPVTFSEYLENNPPTSQLTALFAGSWINHNFNIWIGHPEDNAAWEYLGKARDELLRYQAAHPGEKDNLDKAWQEIYVAEGSDWCWWFGDDHSSEHDSEFDRLFRTHVKNVYRLIGEEHPRHLDSPIKKMKVVKVLREPAYLIEPVLDGEVTNYYEWLSAGYFDIEKARGAMHQTETVIKGIYFGFNLTHLFFRLDPSADVDREDMKGLGFDLYLFKPSTFRLGIAYSKEEDRFLLTLFALNEAGEWERVGEEGLSAVGRIIELKVPMETLAVNHGEMVEFAVGVRKLDQEMERWPKGGIISFKTPTKDYELDWWSV